MILTWKVFIHIPNLLSFIRSNFPISKKRPPCAKQRTEACSLFSAREFKTKLTPSPFVSLITNCSKVVSLEFPIWLSLIYQIYKIKWLLLQRQIKWRPASNHLARNVAKFIMRKCSWREVWALIILYYKAHLMAQMRIWAKEE